MKRAKGRLLAGVAILAVVAVAAGAVWVASPRAAGAPMLIFTQIRTDDAGWNGGDGPAQWFPDRSRIVAMDADANDGGVRVLTAEFHSARAPMVSPDGRRLLFSGRRHEDDPWQIWEMRLNDGRTRLLTPGPGWYTDPAYLADGRVVLSGRPGAATDAFALYTTAGTGAGLMRITFHLDRDLGSQVLQDGQVLFVSSPADQVNAGARYLVTRPDGTGLRLFYRSADQSRPGGRAWETEDRRVVLVERGGRGSAAGVGGRLVALAEARPLHSRVELSDRVAGSFHSLHPLESGNLLVSYRPAGGRNFSLYEFDPVAQRLEGVLSDDPAYHAVEPVVAAKRARPKTFFSVVDSAVKIGELYCLDANLSSLPPARASRASMGQRLRMRGLDGLLGEVPLAADGSFYIELPADLPVTLETVDDRGQVVRGPSAWLWVRPNERRGCVGCHQDPELAPANRVPNALMGAPVALPLARSKAAGSSPP